MTAKTVPEGAPLFLAMIDIRTVTAPKRKPARSLTGRLLVFSNYAIGDCGGGFRLNLAGAPV